MKRNTRIIDIASVVISKFNIDLINMYFLIQELIDFYLAFEYDIKLVKLEIKLSYKSYSVIVFKQ